MTEETIDTADLRARILADVRAGLARAGRTDIEVRDEWLGEIELLPGRRAPLLTVPIGHGSTLPIWACDRDDGSTGGVAARFAAQLVTILPLVSQARFSLSRYAEEVRVAAESAVSDAHEAGIEIELDAVSFRATRSSHLMHEDWRALEGHALAEIRLTMLDMHLRRSSEAVMVEIDDVTEIIEGYYDEQLERQIKRLVLRRHRANARVDEVTLRLLERYGIEPLDALRRVVEHGSIQFDVALARGGVGTLSVSNHEGQVQSCVLDEPAFVWAYDRLQAEGEGAALPPKPSLGGPVSQICADALYDGMRISAARQEGGCVLYTIEQPRYFVDIGNERIWEDAEAA